MFIPGYAHVSVEDKALVLSLNAEELGSGVAKVKEDFKLESLL
jgi:hypothetical protein